MVVLLLFAFLGGIVTTLSPCILPILPVTFSGGIVMGLGLGLVWTPAWEGGL